MQIFILYTNNKLSEKNKKTILRIINGTEQRAQK